MSGVVGRLEPVQYVRIESDVIAYRDHGGDGPVLVYLGTSGSHQDLIWDEPASAHLLTSLASFGRLITLDRRGAGLSTRVRKPTIEARVLDVERVLDHCGVEAAVLVASMGTTQAALVFAGTHPDRCDALVLYAPVARSSRASHYSIGVPRSVLQAAIDSAESTWGTGITAWLYAPSLADDPQFVAWAARYERSLATPLEAREWIEMFDETDITDVLPHVTVPTLVVTPTDAGDFAPAASHYVAEHIPNATELNITARDQWPFGDGRAELIAALDSFLGDRLHLMPTRSSGRRLAAVLFTDLVASTESVATAGDRRWHSTLEAHDDLAQRVTARLGGRLVKLTGDGVLAVFDGPAAAIETAVEILTALPRLGVQGRASVHFGEVQDRDTDIAGIGVHLCSRILDLAQPGGITTSTTVRDLVAGSGLRFGDRGDHHLKGFAEAVKVLEVIDKRLPGTADR
jgi:class 3 adenylate cyclase